MRFLQNQGLGRSYTAVFDRLAPRGAGFAERLRAFLHDRYGATHILQPVYDGDPDAFFTNGDDDVLQQAWARENGVPEGASQADILLAQIEHHRTEVFYNSDPFRFDAAFVKRLPASVKVKIAWRAAPGKIDFTGYDRVVSNFPSIRADYERQGLRTAELYPAHDPVLDEYAGRAERPVDVVFCGGFSRHHGRRREILEQVAALSGRYRVAFHLDASRFTPLAESPLGWVGPLRAVRRPRAIRQVAAPSVFGRAMYQTIGSAKIVLNAAIDMAGEDRGNMRCFEAMGAGTGLVTDAGRYPEGMVGGATMSIYASPAEAAQLIARSLETGAWAEQGRRAHETVSQLYTKRRQIEAFTAIVAGV